LARGVGTELLVNDQEDCGDAVKDESAGVVLLGGNTVVVV
jgi:hypothetical protein